MPFHRRLTGSLFPFLRFFFPLSYGLFFLNSKCVFSQPLKPSVPTDKLWLPKLLDSRFSKEATAQGSYSDIRTTNRFFSPVSPRVNRLSIITTYKRNNRLKGFRSSNKKALNILSSVKPLLASVPFYKRPMGSLFPFLRFFFPLSYGLFFLNSK